MRELKVLRNTISIYFPLSKIDREILKTLIRIKVGNAYATWKASGLKHYPTVLRSLKKLEARRCVEVSKKGMRGEKQYVPMQSGILISLVSEENLKEIREIFANNSYKFRELLKANVPQVDDWAVSIVEDMLRDVAGKRKVIRSIDEILEVLIVDHLAPHFLSVHEEHSRNEIIEMARFPWVRQLVLEEIETNLGWIRKQVESLEKLKETLTKNNR